MMKKSILVIGMVLSFLALPFAADADIALHLKNETGITIWGLFAARAGTEDYSADLLSEVWHNGEELDDLFSDDRLLGSQYDLKVTFMNEARTGAGDYAVYRDLPVNANKTISLYPPVGHVGYHSESSSSSDDDDTTITKPEPVKSGGGGCSAGPGVSGMVMLLLVGSAALLRKPFKVR
jgi:hypothetical protein